jgi:hypothetical protein
MAAFPSARLWNAVQLPAIRAAIALHRDEPAKSLELLTSASPYERAHLEAVYLRGLVYLRPNKGGEAAAEFRKIVDHKGANWASGWRYPYWATVLFAFPSRTSARLCSRGRHGDGQEGVPGPSRNMEGRRPGPSDPSASQNRIRPAAHIISFFRQNSRASPGTAFSCGKNHPYKYLVPGVASIERLSTSTNARR